eukprot:15431465-Alexandrium_andersonii.AAC.1
MPNPEMLSPSIAQILRACQRLPCSVAEDGRGSGCKGPKPPLCLVNGLMAMAVRCLLKLGSSFPYHDYAVRFKGFPERICRCAQLPHRVCNSEM